MSYNNDTRFSKLVWDITSVSSGDLQTAPNPDGSDFIRLQQKFSGFPGMVLINFNIFGVAVSSLNPAIRLYRKCPITNLYYKGNLLTLSTPITSTTTGEYIATQNYEISASDFALALESAETDARLRIVANIVSKQSK